MDLDIKVAMTAQLKIIKKGNFNNCFIKGQEKFKTCAKQKAVL